MIRRKLGFAWKYSLVLTLRLPEPEPSSASTTTKISFCRTLGEDRSLTVAKVEQHGAVADVVLPATTTTQFEKLDDLRAIYGTYQAETQAALQTFANTQALPDWYKTETEHLYAWRSASRYLRLYRLWKDQRFAGDEEAFAKLEQFRERYRHLYSWESNLRDQLFRRRREQYRVIASQLVNTSGKIVIDELPAVTRKRAETESVVKTHQRRWDRIACRSVLKNTIESTARRQGVVIEVVSLAEQLGAVGSPGTARVA